MNRRLLDVASWSIVLGAPALLLAVQWACVVDLPRWDEWEFAGFLARASRGEIGLADVLAQYNDHRMALSRVVMLVFAHATDWNLRAQALVAPALAALTLVLLAGVGRRTAGRRHVAWLAATATTSVFVFSPTQDDNWMMALQHAFFVPGTCLAGILAVAGARWPSWARWTASACLAVIGCLSVSSGFLLWLVALPALWWPPDGARQQGRGPGLALWTVTASLTAWLFFRNYQALSAAQPLVDPVSDALQFWPYFFSFLGAPFARGTAWPTLTVATCFGAILFAAFAATTWEALRSDHGRRAAMPWLVLGAFAVATAVSGAEMRSALGQFQSTSSRYATFSLMLPVAVTWLVLVPPRVARPGPPPSRLGVAASLVLVASVALVGLSSLRAIEEMVQLSRSVRAARAAMGFLGHVADTQPLAVLYMEPNLLPALAAPLWKAGWLRPARRLGATVPAGDDVADATGSGRIEAAQGTGEAVTVAGWAIIPQAHAPADLVAIAAHGPEGAGRVVAFGAMQPDIERADLGLRGDPRRASAWNARVPRASLPPGTTSLSAWALDGSSGRAFRIGGTVDLPQGVVR